MIQKNPPIGHWFMPRQYVCRCGIVLCTFLWILSFSIFVFADDDDVVEYSHRRWFIHEDKIDDSLFLSPSLEVGRQNFERLLARAEQRSKGQSDNQPYLSKIVLKATLEGRQLTSGQGFFTLHPRSDRTHSIPLSPLTLAVNSLRWSDDTDAIFFYMPNGESRLLVPSETDSNAYDQLQFRWSLQSQQDTRNGIVFDFSLPPCLSIELQLDLPGSMILTTSKGFVLPDEEDDSVAPDNPESARRIWRVLLGHHSDTTLTITTDKTLQSTRQQPSIRQRTNYFIMPQGLEILTRIVFERADVRPEELLLELEMPLRPVEVRYGDRPAVWTKTATSPEISEVRVDLSPFADEEPQEIVIRALGPLLENQRWVLPRMRVTSPDIFWMETRCGVWVRSPLRARNLFCHQAVQVAPRSTFDWADEELYVFQFFQNEAQIELEVVYSIPHVSVNSTSQIQWSDNDISSTVYLECSVLEGEWFALNFPVSEHWIIDSVTSYQPTSTVVADEGDPIFSWEVMGDVQSQMLSVQLNRPLRPRRPVTLQITCRSANSSQSQFRLADLSLLALPHRRGESHYIAVQLDLTAYQVKSSVDASVFNVPRSLMVGGNSLGFTGSFFPLDAKTQDIRFEKERMRPNYTAKLSGNIYIDDDECISTFRVRCTPIDSSISRVFMHFTSPCGENWEWSLGSDSNLSRPLRALKISPDEFKELLPPSEQQNWSEDFERGEIWEIRFDDFQTVPFDLSAISLIPLGDSIVIPLASVPLASAQSGELTIESPQHFDYQIVGGRLVSIPIDPAPWDRYQNVRAAFRYDPQEELHRSQHSPLMLQKLAPDERGDIAWVWSLRLDSQHASEGVVQNKALFLIENRGKDSLQITLPYRVSVADVFAIWRDSQQVSWHCDEDRRTINVALPVGKRFVSIAIEYIYQDQPLVQQRKVRPLYPTTDIPVLSASWISWFPPEFDVSLRHTTGSMAAQSTNKVSLSKAMDHLLTRTYRSFLGSMWDDVLYGEQRRLEAETGAEYFFAEVANTFQNHPAATWGNLTGNERIISAVRARLADDNTKRPIEVKLLIDKQALVFLGITPATPIETLGPIHEANVRKNLFEDAGLILLVATRTRSDRIKEYVFALTTPTTLALNQQFHPIPAGHCVRAVPYEIFDSIAQSQRWIHASQWLSETILSSIPWSISTQVIQRTGSTLDWNAYEFPVTMEQPLYIVHRQKFAALQWIAFLSVVLLTCRKPFSSPIVLFILLITFELVARSVASCYVGIPSGAFLGVLVSFAFVLIRSQISPNDLLPEHSTKHDSTECSVSFVPMPLSARSVVLCGLLSVLFGASASAQTFPEQRQNLSRKEPHRIIYPTDSEWRVVGEKIWVPKEFLDLLHQNVNTDAPATLPRWNMLKAVYQGSLIRGSTGFFECSNDFKAVYDIYLDSSRVIITLPGLPAVHGKFYWNGRPIQPIWNDGTQNGSLSFAIENETPGKHTLEIALSPKAILQSDGETFQIAFAIPKVPDSTLRLNVPSDVAPINVPDALGAITANTAIAPVLTAELGPTQQFSLSWTDDPHRSETLVSEVEQFFRMRVKPLQIILETSFRFHINGGSVRHLFIQTDPRWVISGQFQCVEGYPIEKTSDAQSFDGLSSFQYNVSRIDFQSPVTGIVTLRADFIFAPWPDPVRRDQVFYGIGRLRLPEFRAEKSRITKSMLAVYADPTLELSLPSEGRSSDFEAGWKGASGIVPQLLMDGSFFEPLFSRPTGTFPDAEYDLNRTEPDWTLNIRAKKTIPDVAVSQSILFDTGESRVRVVGEFMADSNVFQQQFSVDYPIQIEAIEVLDSQGTVVESRFQQTAPETMPEQYLVFFKRPVTGQYTITVRGFFETDVREESQLQSVPVLTFGKTQTTEHLLNLLRTTEVIATMPLEQSGWVRSSTLPALPTPELFAQSIPLGTWRRAEATGSESAPLQFTLSPNRPKVRCKTVLSLNTDADEQWTLTLNSSVNVTDGELRLLRFRWDERCGVIPPMEPDASWSLDSSGGQQVLTLSFNEPIRGERHVKIIVPLGITGAVMLPNISPLTDGIEQFESDVSVDLPFQLGNEIIPWVLNQLEIDEQTVNDQRLSLRAMDTHFSAVINRDEARLTAVFYDISFLIRQNGAIFGIVTVDLRNPGQDSFILQMPDGYEPIQISSAGLMLGRTRLTEGNRWRINIGTSDYPQRFSMLFRASLPQQLKQWNQEQVVSMLQFPLLEGVVVQETIWMAALEGDLPPLNVTSVRDRHGSSGVITPGVLGTDENDLGEHTPISGKDVTLSLIGINLIRQSNLLQVLKSLPTSFRQDEVQRWFLHWLDEWNTVADKVEFQISHLPLTLHNVRPQLITRPADPVAKGAESTGIIRSLLEIMGARTPDALRDDKEQTVQEKFGSTMDFIPKQPIPVLTSQVYWQGRVSEKVQYLFGTEKGALQTIRLTSVPNTGGWMLQSSEHIWLGISLSLLIPVVVLLSVRWIHLMELWLQFPHFWGMTLGILLWTFLPESFLGPIIMALTFMSFFRPSWVRHRSRMYS